MCVHVHEATQIIYSYYPDLPTTMPQQSPHNMNLPMERSTYTAKDEGLYYVLTCNWVISNLLDDHHDGGAKVTPV